MRRVSTESEKLQHIHEERKGGEDAARVESVVHLLL